MTEDEWYDEMFGNTNEQRTWQEVNADSDKFFGNWDAIEKERSVTPAANLREKYGIAAPFEGMRDDIMDIREVSQEGMGKDILQGAISSQASGMSRGVTGQLREGLSNIQSLGPLSTGAGDEMKAKAAGAKVSEFGKILQALTSQDESMRANAKSALMEMIMTKQQLDQSLVMQEEQLRAQLSSR